jgi:hypothetical protein
MRQLNAKKNAHHTFINWKGLITRQRRQKDTRVLNLIAVMKELREKNSRKKSEHDGEGEQGSGEGRSPGIFLMLHGKF